MRESLSQYTMNVYFQIEVQALCACFVVFSQNYFVLVLQLFLSTKKLIKQTWQQMLKINISTRQQIAQNKRRA